MSDTAMVVREDGPQEAPLHDKGAEVRLREVDESLAISLARAEMDQLTVTARAMPRSFALALKNILELATLDDETADECIYALPRGGKEIEGPSIRFAEIIVTQWGNCRVATRVVHVDRTEKYVEAEATFLDLQTNYASQERVRRSIRDKNGRVFNDDMIVVTGNAARAIAKRNAILAGVPKPIWRKAYKAVEGIIAGDQKPMAERRNIALARFAKFNVTPEQIFAALGVKGVEDITAQHLVTLTGMRSALNSGEATLEEMFRPVAGDGPQGLAAKMDALAASGDQKPAEASPGPAGGAAAPGGATGGEENKTGQQPAQPTSGTATPSGKEKAKPKRDKKEPAAAASPQPDDGADPAAPETDKVQDNGSAGAHPPSGAAEPVGTHPGTPAGDKEASPPQEPVEEKAPASEAAPAGLQEPQRNALREYHRYLGNAITLKALQNGSANYVNDHPPFGEAMLSEGPYGEAINRIYGLHLRRVTGKNPDGTASEISIADIDNEVRRLAAG